MSELASPKPENKADRLSTVTTVLIAVVSTVIALVASQAATASGNATEAQHNGVIAKINLERTDGGAWAKIARSRRAFATYRFNRRLYDLTFDYIAQAESGGTTPLGNRLRQEAAAQLEESNLAYAFTDAAYLVEDEEGNLVDFDVDNFLNDQRQVAAIYQDIDYDDNFEEADALRTQSLTLNISVLFWVVALGCFTWAEISRSALRWLWLGAGLLISLAIVGVYILSGITAVLGF